MGGGEERVAGSGQLAYRATGDRATGVGRLLIALDHFSPE